MKESLHIKLTVFRNYIRQDYRFLVLCAIVLVFLLLVSRVYYLRAASFSFIDEYNNFLAGHFLLSGKRLYEQIFFQHNMFAAYISLIIQYTLNPDSLYKLVLYHRIFIIIFSFFMDILLLYRFRVKAIGFILFFEVMKFYFFGGHFLAESMVVYPLVYLFGLSLEKIHENKLSNVDYILSIFYTWFVVFMREPYIPLALFLFGFVLFWKEKRKTQIVSVVSFFLLSLISMAPIALSDFFSQVFVFNTQTVIKAEVELNEVMSLKGIGAIVFYPIYIVLSGKWNFFRQVLIGLDVLFLILTTFYIVKLKQIKQIVFILLALSLATIRYVIPGTQFYEAYHMLVWFGIFIYAIIFLTIQLYNHPRYKKICMFAVITLLIILMLILLPFSYLWEKVDRQEDFTRNYGRFYANGEVVRRLASGNDSLFVQSWDSLILWQAGLEPAYRYIFFYPVAYNIEPYKTQRQKMFKENPPAFYYSDSVCETMLSQSDLEPFIKTSYSQIMFDGKSSCLMVKNSVKDKISQEKWNRIKELGFHI